MVIKRSNRPANCVTLHAPVKFFMVITLMIAKFLCVTKYLITVLTVVVMQQLFVSIFLAYLNLVSMSPDKGTSSSDSSSEIVIG